MALGMMSLQNDNCLFIGLWKRERELKKRCMPKVLHQNANDHVAGVHDEFYVTLRKRAPESLIDNSRASHDMRAQKSKLSLADGSICLDDHVLWRLPNGVFTLIVANCLAYFVHLLI